MDELFIPAEVRPDAATLVGKRAWQAAALLEVLHAEIGQPYPAVSPPEGDEEDNYSGGPERRSRR